MISTEKPIPCLTEVIWYEVAPPIPHATFVPWNTICPTEGGRCVISVKKLTGCEVLEAGQVHWALFEPANAYLNGYDQDVNPEELDLCAIIEIEITNISPIPTNMFGERESDRLLLECHCHRVVPLAQIPRAFPPLPEPTKRARGLTRTTGKTVSYFLQSFHEWHNWFVVTNPPTTLYALPHIVLFGNYDDSHCYICNWVVECDKTSWQAA
ncbi:hypothetical protein EON83_00485 [bacterium]|nr:MAG: hypothetical protein EON83_00485 [bacterium]